MKHNFNRSKTAVALYAEDNEQKTCFTVVSFGGYIYNEKEHCIYDIEDNEIFIRTSVIEHEHGGIDYEIWYVFDEENAKKLVSLFGGAEKFLKNLKKKYSGSDSCSEILKFAKRNGIKYRESDKNAPWLRQLRYDFRAMFFEDIRLYDEHKNFLIPYVYTPPQEGTAKIYYKNGNIKAELPYKDGKLHGLSKCFYSSGNICWEQNYSNDKIDGKTMNYYENGNIKHTDVFIKGVKEGPDQSFDEEGHLIEDVMWVHNGVQGPAKLFYSNGKVKFEAFFVKSRQQGNAKGYYETGELQFEAEFKDGKTEGEAKEYYKNGNIYSIVPWKNGEPDGTARFYYESGRIMWITQYKDGKLDGDSVMFSTYGRVKAKNSWKAGMLQGTKCTFAEDGTLELSINYADGKPENISEHSRFKPHIMAWEKITSEPSLRSGKFEEEKERS